LLCMIFLSISSSHSTATTTTVKFYSRLQKRKTHKNLRNLFFWNFFLTFLLSLEKKRIIKASKSRLRKISVFKRTKLRKRRDEKMFINYINLNSFFWTRFSPQGCEGIIFYRVYYQKTYKIYKKTLINSSHVLSMWHFFWTN
jgi:hypothetical protein